MTFDMVKSGIAADPDQLLQVGTQLWAIALVDDNKTLRVTYVGRP